MYKVVYDLHTHTKFSHGKGSIEDNVKVALEKGLEAIAISDHGPGHLTYGVKRDDIPVMRKEIERLSLKYPNIKIFLSVEANIIDSGNFLDICTHEFREFDMVLAGYHFGIKNGYTASNFAFNYGIGRTMKRKEAIIARNTQMVINAIEKNDLKVLTHPGDKAPVDIKRIARACAMTNTLMEINNRHKNLSVEDLIISEKEGANFVVSSDAHSPEKVGECDNAIARIIDSKIDWNRVVNIKRV